MIYNLLLKFFVLCGQCSCCIELHEGKNSLRTLGSLVSLTMQSLYKKRLQSFTNFVLKIVSLYWKGVEPGLVEQSFEQGFERGKSECCIRFFWWHQCCRS